MASTFSIGSVASTATPPLELSHETPAKFMPTGDGEYERGSMSCAEAGRATASASRSASESVSRRSVLHEHPLDLLRILRLQQRLLQQDARLGRIELELLKQRDRL